MRLTVLKTNARKQMPETPEKRLTLKQYASLTKKLTRKRKLTPLQELTGLLDGKKIGQMRKEFLKCWHGVQGIGGQVLKVELSVD